MSIDWLTVVAQIVNFLVLVWLLQRFLYEPITRAMAAREAHMRRQMDDTAASKRLAEADARRLDADLKALAERREEMLAVARSEADKLRGNLETQLRSEIEAKRRDWQDEIEGEQDEFIAELRNRAVDHYYALARQALGGLAGKTLNEAIADSLTDKLAELTLDDSRKLKAAARQTESSMLVESSFALSTSMKRRIVSAIHEYVMPDVEPEYLISTDMTCGVRLRVGGQAVSWSLDSYLDRMEEEARQSFDEEVSELHSPARA